MPVHVNEPHNLSEEFMERITSDDLPESSEEASDMVVRALKNAANADPDQSGIILDPTPLVENTEYPWERQPGEPALWYHRFFHFFLLAGPSRNIYGAYRRQKRDEDGVDLKALKRTRYYSPPPNWHGTAIKWHWKVRAEAFDDFYRQIEEEKWAERRLELREEEWRASQGMLSAAQNALIPGSGDSGSVDSIKTGISNGRVQQKPVKLSASDIPRFVESGSKIGRLASGMDDDRTVTVQIQAKIREIRELRWDQTLPELAAVLAEEPIEGEFEDVPGPLKETVEEDEVVDEPPMADHASPQPGSGNGL